MTRVLNDDAAFVDGMKKIKILFIEFKSDNKKSFAVIRTIHIMKDLGALSIWPKAILLLSLN